MKKTLLLVFVLAVCFGCAFAERMILPAGLKVIEPEAFYGDESLSDVILPEGIGEIGALAFADSGITTINLPASLRTIDDTAFDATEIEYFIAKKGTYGYLWASGKGYKVVEPFTLSETDVMIPVKGTVVLRAIEAVQNATESRVIWKSDNDHVAAVVDGTVTAVAAGEANISATNANGITATCHVSVLANGTPVPINAAAFPDETFREIVKKAFDTDDDGILSKAEISAAKILECSDQKIVSVRGIEFLPDLEKLDCSTNRIDRIDVSFNKKLIVLDCAINDLRALDVSQNTELEYLNCSINGLSTLDVTHNTYLRYLYCYINGLTSLDLSNNKQLMKVDCAYCYMKEFEAKNAPDLWYLDCSNQNGNKLEIHIEKNPFLTIAYQLGTKTRGENKYMSVVYYEYYYLGNYMRIDEGSEIFYEDATVCLEGANATIPQYLVYPTSYSEASNGTWLTKNQPTDRGSYVEYYPVRGEELYPYYYNSQKTACSISGLYSDSYLVYNYGSVNNVALSWFLCYKDGEIVDIKGYGGLYDNVTIEIFLNPDGTFRYARYKKGLFENEYDYVFYNSSLGWIDAMESDNGVHAPNFDVLALTPRFTVSGKMVLWEKAS